MPTCQKCHCSFPVWTHIGGIRRNLGTRKYCLTCSPRGAHNTRKIHLAKTEQAQKTCLLCRTEKPTSEYYRLRRGLFYSYCKDCDRERAKSRMSLVKTEAVSRMGGKCVVCGYNRYLGALEFHHIDPQQKDFKISGQMRLTEKVVRELDKCALVCATCHAEIHGGVTKLP